MISASKFLVNTLSGPEESKLSNKIISISVTKTHSFPKNSGGIIENVPNYEFRSLKDWNNALRGGSEAFKLESKPVLLDCYNMLRDAIDGDSEPVQPLIENPGQISEHEC